MVGIRKFQPALPVWGVTGIHELRTLALEISTRTPRVGSDSICPSEIEILSIFQPALPVWGVTPLIVGVYDAYNDFNPHSPCGE